MLRLISGYRKTFLGVNLLEYGLMLVLAGLAAVAILFHLVPPDEAEAAIRSTAEIAPANLRLYVSLDRIAYRLAEPERQ